MDRAPQTLLIVAGEESGDMRAAALVREIKALCPGTRFIGIGGNRCREAGVDTFTDITELAVIGFTEVIKNFARIKRVFNLTLTRALAERPQAVILVDYPGFNLRLAQELKKNGIKVIYYISPQVWAWKESRVKTIKNTVARMMVLFPFEKDLYARHGYTADLVGHPLVDEVRADIPRHEFLTHAGLDHQKKVIALLPGSRTKEISRHLPVMLEAARIILKKNPDIQFILLKAKNLGQECFSPWLSIAPEKLIITEDYYNALGACDSGIVCSGTATLETALMGKPMTVVYKTSWLTWYLGKLLVKIPCIALVNIVAGHKIVEELLQKNASPANIAAEALKTLELSDKLQQELARVKTLLGSPGASRRAAMVVREELAR
ncbi:MAG: lipid-A-disaccharide synthase [Candidatus Omnitrophota bacterium]